MTCIYKITNPLNEVYIGQTRHLPTRIRQHRASKNTSKISMSIKRFGFDTHKVEVIQSFTEGCSIDVLNFHERHYIERYTIDGVRLMNISKGGSGATNEVRKALSDKKTGKERPSFKGSGNPFHGKKHTKESLKKMSEHSKSHNKGAGNGRARAIYQYDLQGNFIKEYDTVTNASKATGVNRLTISACLTGQNKKAKGFIWKYK